MKPNSLKEHFQKISIKRSQTKFSKFEIELIHHIKSETKAKNVDNISRTKSYMNFYNRNPEIRWAFLASMVSRNAGWNMTDLQGIWLPKILSEKKRIQLFETYERANWLIFADVYPQLLLYEMSKFFNTSFVHMLKAFYVSVYMEIEWQKFLKQKDEQRLMYSLIINEQNVIQKPVIEHPYFNKNVFHSFAFQIQDWFHFSQVLFPTLEGRLFGFSVYDFRNVKARIKLGKRLAWLLFHHKYYQDFYMFSEKNVHTGSRYDYEQYFPCKNLRETPFLRMVYPKIKHERHEQKDWFHGQPSIEKLQKKPKIPADFELGDWYLKKQAQLRKAIHIESKLIK